MLGSRSALNPHPREKSPPRATSYKETEEELSNSTDFVNQKQKAGMPGY